jgi:hypothetical protein
LRKCKRREGIFVERNDFKENQHLSSYVYQIAKRDKLDKKFSIRKLNDGGGWTLLRIN